MQNDQSSAAIIAPSTIDLQAAIDSIHSYRLAYEAIPDALLIMSIDGTIIHVNSHALDLFGYTNGELIGQLVEILVAERYRDKHPQQRQSYFTEPHVRPMGSNLDLFGRHRNGDDIPVEISLAPLCTDAGVMAVATIRDLTNQRLFQQQLKQLNQTLESRVEERTSELSATNLRLQNEVRDRQKAEEEIRRINADLEVAHAQAVAANMTKSQFLANMSHELRTPLNAIIGYSELLQLIAAEKNDPSMHADLDKIKRSGTHLLAIINDILDISKIEAGRLQVEQQPFRVLDILNDIRESGLQLAQKNRNRFRIDIEDNLWPVFADFVRLKQCLLNLISNACKFTENGSITLTIKNELGNDRDWVTLAIQDTGIGISPEQIAGLFQPFTQADASTSRRYEGTGLGLAITKKLCEAMGGSIALQSEIGVGSTFTIRIPRYVKSMATANEVVRY